ncbi:hypothetical protein DMENIID0001_154440 [Sergentomyia squamirostris]
MSKILELFNEARPMINLQTSFTTFQVSLGLWKHRFLIIVSMTVVLLGIYLSSKHLIRSFDGDINLNIMMSALGCISFSQLPMKSFFGMIKHKTFYKCLEEIEDSYSDQEDDEELNQISEKHLVNSLWIWNLVYKYDI